MKNNFILVTIIMLAVIFSVNVNAEDKESIASKKIKEIEGVYKNQFEIGIYNPDQDEDDIVKVEDIVEIVRHTSDEIYFSADLQFNNGYNCSIYGIAKYDNGIFVYKSGKISDPDETPCTIKISTNEKYLVITDQPNEEAGQTCNAYCGMNASLTNYEIELSYKKKIDDISIIKKSTQYAAAVDELAKRKATSDSKSPTNQ
jgi:hypothetical protein